MDPTTGRGLLIFAAIIFVFGLFVGIAQQALRDAVTLLSIAVFMGCYGVIMLNKLPHLHRGLLILGLASGVAGFVVAVLMMLEL